MRHSLKVGILVLSSTAAEYVIRNQKFHLQSEHKMQYFIQVLQLHFSVYSLIIQRVMTAKYVLHVSVK